MGILSDPRPETFQSLETEADVYEAVADVPYTLLDPDFSAIVREIDGELSIVASRSSTGSPPTLDLSRLSIPGLCHIQRESCKIDDQTDVRSQAAKPHSEVTFLSQFCSLIVIPIGISELIILGVRETNAFSEQDFQIAESIGEFATAYLDDLRSDTDETDDEDSVEQIATVLSPDVNNLLTTISGNFQLVEEDIDSEDFEQIERNLNRLYELIQDAVDALRSGTKDPDLEIVDLAPVVTESWDIVGREDVDLIVEDLGQTIADESKLCQVFENLLGNAVKHGGSDGVVWVGRFEDGIYIEDYGPGIPPAERKHVFKFGYSSMQDNTGFGLSIVNWIIQAHEWDITVSESELGGARFEISGVPLVRE